MALKVLLRARRLGRRREGRELVIAKERDAFYAGEVTRILKLQSVDYVQLRRLFNLVRGNALSTTQKRGRRSWRRFTFRDLRALRVATRLVFGTDDRHVQRARISKLKEACDHLRSTCGLKDPLLEADFTADGGEIFVRLRGKTFDRAAQQRVFDEVAWEVERHARNAERDGIPKSPTISRATLRQSTDAAAYLVPATSIQRRRR